MPAVETTKQDLLALEHQFWNAIKDRDTKTATRLTGEQSIVVGAQGANEVDQPTLAKMLTGANYELKSFSLDDVHMREISDDVVAMAYKVTEDLVVDGEEITLEAFDSSVWARRDGGWVCVLHTESPAGDPFGRH